MAETDGHLRLGSVGELTYVAGPTDAGLYMAAVCPPLAVKDAFLADRERSFMAGIAAWPELAELLEGATRTGPIRVMANWHGYFREAAGPGWALVGDAGNFKDPSPAQGIADALRQAERLAEAIEAGLSEAACIDEELRRWWRWRDEDGYEMHWFATDMGRAGPSPPLACKFTRDMAADEEATKQLLQVLNHDIPPSRLFTPRRLGKAAARAARADPDQIPAMVKEATSELRNEIRRSGNAVAAVAHLGCLYEGAPAAGPHRPRVRRAECLSRHLLCRRGLRPQRLLLAVDGQHALDAVAARSRA